jgi:hypothetical protein
MEQPMDDLSTRLRTLKEFLRGAGEMEGRWFGEQHKPAFWWRKHLADIDLALTRIAVLEAEVARLKETADEP